MVEVGKVYTIDACKRTGDRSYRSDLWRVIAANERCAIVVSLAGALKPDGYWNDKPHLLHFNERDFHPVSDEIVDAMYPSFKATADVR